MSKNPVTLLVDPDEQRAEQVASQLLARNFTVVRSSSLREANDHLNEMTPELAVIALDLTDGDGLTLLKHPGLDSTGEIILTDHQDDRSRVRQGMLAGANYFFCHPADQHFLNDLFEDLAVELRQRQSQLLSVFSTAAPMDQFGLLRGSSPHMHKLYRRLRKVAPSNASVLLIGENGTGKELVARTIHQLSDRSNAPFVSVSCSAVSAEQMDATLFGREHNGIGHSGIGHSGIDGGGSNGPRIGLFEQTYGGTLLLEEIAEMPGETQVKLLRTLETNRLRRTGGEHDIHTDVRIIAAINRNPEEAIHARQLREDLYFEIANAPLHVPPLRTRGGDIRGLAEYFLGQFNAQSGEEKTLTGDAAAVLESYSWPGNVRELRSVMKQAHIMAEQDIAPEHLPDLDGQPASSGDVLQLNIGDSVQDAEKKLTLATLTFYNGDKRKAAQTLGVSLKTLYNRINAYHSDKQAASVSSAAD